MSESNTEGQALTPEERDAQMAEKFRQQQNAPAAENLSGIAEEGNDDDKPQRPEHIPEKFWDAEKGEVRLEEMAKSYAELEKRGAKPADDGDGKDGDGKGGDGKGGDDKDGDLSFEKIAADITASREQLTAKITAGEELTDEDFAPYEKVGVSRADIEAFIEGQKALGQLAQAQIHQEVGGEDSYKAMIAWARDNFSPAEIQAYDRDIYSNDREVNMAAVRGLAARYQLANGRDSRDPTLNANGTSGNAGYASKAEMLADMRDPKYAKDSAFREQVARKVAAATAAGIDLRS